MRRLLAVVLFAGAAFSPAIAQNRAPTVNAGADTTLRLGFGFNFSFVEASDPDGDALTYAWTRVSGTEGGASIVRPDALGSRVVLSLVGEYVFRIDVSDGMLTSSDTIKVSVIDSLLPRILTPAAGHQVLAGSTSIITWQINQPASFVNLELSRDNGMTWSLLNAGRVSGGSFEWDVTEMPSDSCLIMVYPYGVKNNVLAVSGIFAIVDRIDSSSVRGPGISSFPRARGEARTMGVFQVNGRSIPNHQGRRLISMGTGICGVAVEPESRHVRISGK